MSDIHALLVLPASATYSWATLASAPPVAGRSDGGGTPAAPGGSQGGAPTSPAGPPVSNPMGGQFLFLLVALFGVMILMQVFAGRKEKKRRAEMISSIKRHDRVQTIGGVIGTVAEVRDDEIVLKVDESTNTKIRFAKSSVQQVIKSSSGASDPDEAPTAKVGV